MEGSLVDLTVVAPLAFFTWNDQTFSGRVRRRGLIFLMAMLRPFLYAANRKFATCMVHTVLRGVTRDRLDLLGEEYFQYRLKPRLKPEGVQKVRELLSSGADVVLVSQGLDHVMRPLARYLGAKHLVANRLEFRDRVATGRLLEPVIRPRGVFARLREQHPDGRRAPKTLARHLGISVEVLREAVIGADREVLPRERPIVNFDGQTTGGRILGPSRFARKARDADRRYRLYWESVAGEYAARVARGRANLSSHPAAEIESGRAALREDGGRVAGVRSAV